ncbi:MAG: hypothetical protein ABSH53_17300 [Holophaga sp.]|jgi:hypothetical protein
MRLRSTLPLGTLLLAVNACNSPRFTPPATPPRAAPVAATPAWVDNEEIPDGIAAVGIAQPNPMGDKGMQRTVAAADARTKLAGKLKVRVQNMFTQLNQQVTTAAAQTGEKPVRNDVMNRVIANVTRQLVDQELVGASTRYTWTDPVDGSLYLFMVMSKENVNVALASTAKTEIRKEIAQGQSALKPALPKVDKAVADSDYEEKLNANLDQLDPTKPAGSN